MFFGRWQTEVSEAGSDKSAAAPVDYDELVDLFNRALIHTLRKHSVADGFLDFWVPDSDPVSGIVGMIDSARIAGLDSVTVRVRRTTVPPERIPELERALIDLCSPRTELTGDAIILRADGIRPFAGDAPRTGESRPPADRKLDARRAAPAPDGAAAAPWGGGELPEFGDVHPYFRPHLRAALASLSREGNPGAPADGSIEVAGADGSATLFLSVDPDTHVVRRARHAGASKPSERAILDLSCRAAENLPIQEVADHVGLKVLDSMVDPDKVPIRGILLPANAGPPFLLPSRLARRAYQAYRRRVGLGDETNFYYAPPGADWLALLPDRRRDRVIRAVRAFLQSEGLAPDDIEFLRIEKNKYGYEVRVVVGFSERLTAAEKPALMRRLERRLRGDLDHQIELLADRARDTSPLRRLS